MALNDTLVRAAKPRVSSWKLADEKGLFLLVTPSGGKLWKLKYRIAVRRRSSRWGPIPTSGWLLLVQPQCCTPLLVSG